MLNNSSPKKSPRERFLLLPIKSPKTPSTSGSIKLQSTVSEKNRKSIDKKETAKSNTSRRNIDISSLAPELQEVKLPPFFFAPPSTSRTARTMLTLNSISKDKSEMTPSTNYKSLSPDANYSSVLSSSMKNIKEFSLVGSSPSLGDEIDENEEFTTPKRSTKANKLKEMLQPCSPRLKRIGPTNRFQKTFHVNTERSSDKYYKMILNSPEPKADRKLVNFNHSHIQHFEEYKYVERLKEVGYNETRRNPVTAMITTSYEKGLLPRNFRTFEKLEQNRNKFQIRYYYKNLIHLLATIISVMIMRKS
jgi:hypothetical protein